VIEIDSSSHMNLTQKEVEAEAVARMSPLIMMRGRRDLKIVS